MRSTWLAIAATSLACASASTQTSATAKSEAPSAPAVAPKTVAPPAPEASGRPTTAAEAAEKAHEDWVRSHGSGGDAAPAGAKRSSADDAPCAADADCTLTRVPPGTCCATLCSPRAVTLARGAELDREAAGCVACVQPLCRDGARVEAACVGGRCTARGVASPD